MSIRRNPPRLVDPAAAHQVETLRSLGVPSGRDRTLAELRARRAGPGDEAPRAVYGQWADGTAGQALLAALAERGDVEDHTTYGDPGFQTLYAPKLVDADSPLFRVWSQAGADTASTTGTVSTVGAMSEVISLGEGLWDLFVCGEVNLKHSANATSAVALVIDLVLAELHLIPTLSSTVWTRVVVAEAQPVRVEGERDVPLWLDYRSNSAGTTSAGNPILQVVARRVE